MADDRRDRNDEEQISRDGEMGRSNEDATDSSDDEFEDVGNLDRDEDTTSAEGSE